MADEEDPADLFAFPDFEKSSKWLNSKLSSDQDNSFFALNLESPDQTSKSSKDDVNIQFLATEGHGFFKLPPLFESLGSSRDQEPGQSHSPVLTPLHDTKLPDLDIFDDGWFQEEQHPPPAATFKTWDGFIMPTTSESTPLFITEASPAVYDAALSSTDDPLNLRNTDHNVIQPNPYVAALLALALGRGSVFFSWDEKASSFTPNLEKMRIPGHSSEVLEGIHDNCLQCGTITRFLSNYVRIIYKTHPSPVRVSLAKAVDTFLLMVQTKLGEKARQIRSVLQLQYVIQPVQATLAYFKLLVTKVVRLKSDEQVLSTVFDETRTLEHVDKLCANIMREVLAQITEPWSDFAEKWIGIKDEEGIPLTKEEGFGKGFVKVERISYMDDFGTEVQELDYVLDEGRMPNFIPTEVASVMFEAGRTLRLLRTHHPEHPLCRTSLISSSKPPALRWHFYWDTITKHQEDVAAYEKSMTQKIRQLTSIASGKIETVDQDHFGDSYNMQFFGHDEAKLEATLLASIQALNQPPSLSGEDSLTQLLRSQLLGGDHVPEETARNFTPHWSLIPIHLFGPLVAAQARLINREYMKLVFSAHRLREHLEIQKQFQLLGNGMFCSRLTHALFDPELETAERQAGVARQGGTMGLRLSGRETWPPASSELRLALMGVLTESYLPSPSATTSGLDTEKQGLLSDVSFAVRDLSAEEIERCMDPGSLEALDFLRLSYKPPAPLSPILTPIILMKYDKIFKLLLRLLRMLYVIGQISRDIVARTSRWNDVDNVSLRFNFEAQHFVTSISTYFFDSGIEMPWRRFESWLDGVETDLVKEVPEPQKARVVSPSELREEHERMLDHMMHTLLLRKRQQAVMRLLEEIFTSILKFSKRTRLASSGKDADGVDEPSARELYDAFKKKVGVFITVCRGLSEKGGHMASAKRNDLTNNDKQDRVTREENTIGRLLIKLEMSGYYPPSNVRI